MHLVQEKTSNFVFLKASNYFYKSWYITDAQIFPTHPGSMWSEGQIILQIPKSLGMSFGGTSHLGGFPWAVSCYYTMSHVSLSSKMASEKSDSTLTLLCLFV